MHFVHLDDDRYWIADSADMIKRIHPSMKMILDDLCNGEKYWPYSGAYYRQGILFKCQEHAIAFKLEYC